MSAGAGKDISLSTVKHLERHPPTQTSPFGTHIFAYSVAVVLLVIRSVSTTSVNSVTQRRFVASQ